MAFAPPARPRGRISPSSSSNPAVPPSSDGSSRRTSRNVVSPTQTRFRSATVSSVSGSTSRSRTTSTANTALDSLNSTAPRPSIRRKPVPQTETMLSPVTPRSTSLRGSMSSVTSAATSASNNKPTKSPNPDSKLHATRPRTLSTTLSNKPLKPVTSIVSVTQKTPTSTSPRSAGASASFTLGQASSSKLPFPSTSPGRSARVADASVFNGASSNRAPSNPSSPAKVVSRRPSASSLSNAPISRVSSATSLRSATSSTPSTKRSASASVSSPASRPKLRTVSESAPAPMTSAVDESVSPVATPSSPRRASRIPLPLSRQSSIPNIISRVSPVSSRSIPSQLDPIPNVPSNEDMPDMKSRTKTFSQPVQSSSIPAQLPLPLSMNPRRTPAISSPPRESPLSSLPYLSAETQSSRRVSLMEFGGNQLDLKELMSKPAPKISVNTNIPEQRRQNSRRATSAVSSDDDGGGRGYRSAPDVTKKQRQKERSKSREVREGRVSTERKEDKYSFLNLASPVVPDFPTISHRSKSFDQDRESRDQSDRGREIVKERKPRNVLKRKSSTRSMAHLQPDSSNHSPYSSRSPSLSPGPGIREQARSESRIGALTPAKEVVMAYKQKELLHLQHDEAEDPSTPYYTVLGSTSGKVVAVGGPEDAWDDISFGSGLASTLGIGIGLGLPSRSHTTVSGGRSRNSTSDGLSKTLSRKLSSRWAKQGDMVRSGDDEKVPAGRPSLQDRRSRRETSYEADFSGRTRSSDNIESAVDEDDHNQARSRKSEPAATSKLWKLMKRLSTGGLRDRYQNETSPSSPITPPPVPALPDYISRSQPKHSVDEQSPRTTGALAEFLQSRPSVSTSRPYTSRKTPPITPSQSTARPSTTTRSSSPGSSDVASSKFFQRSHSQRSSSSSFGEEITRPPIPTTNKYVPQHIVPPSQLYKLEIDCDVDRLENRKLVSMGIIPPTINQAQNSTTVQSHSVDDWMIVRSPQTEVPTFSLGPLPRQRRAPSADEPPPSPIIPEFSTASPINTFSSRKSTEKSPSEAFPSVLVVAPFSSPPPRPARSPRRPSPSTSATSSPLVSPNSARSSLLPEYPSHSVASTARPLRRRSGSFNTTVSGAVPVTPRSVMTFR
ncbi:hypothetical protein C8J56DRAFT_934268 [Mycena floridula]|nr:hypothetical protein C8J56DRAFT_934268 [Mycena floridula]